MQKTIGIAGRARHGKGESAAILGAHYGAEGIPFQKVSLADPLKDFLISLVGRSEPFRGTNQQRVAPILELPWETFSKLFLIKSLRAFGGWKKLWPLLFTRSHRWLAVQCATRIGCCVNGRQLMQLFGTEVIREGLAPDAWVMIAGNKAKLFQGVTCVDDVRFPNEARLRGDGPGIFDNLVKVVRPGMPVIDHPSEWGVDTIPVDWFTEVITNDGSVADLEGKLHRALLHF